MKLLDRYRGTGVIKVLSGIRRCGKSVLLKLLKARLLADGVREDNILLLNFESVSADELKHFKKLYEYVVNFAAALRGGRLYILLDEVQEVEEWERAVASFLVDLDCDIYVTGSNASLLSSELSTRLAGRYVEIPVYPLSFAEYLNFKGALWSGKASERAVIKELFIEYLKSGGFPGIHGMKDDDELVRQYIKGIFSSVLLKDVAQRRGIRDTALLERIALYLMDNVGNIFSAKSVAGFMRNQGRRLGVETVYNDIDALAAAYAFYRARRYDIKGKNVLETLEKYYAADLGLRYALLGFRFDDISGLLENVVYMELLRRGCEVYIGKNGTREVDFVAVRNGVPRYIQVTYLMNAKETVERDVGALKDIHDNYEKLIISMDDVFQSDIDGIRWLNVCDFLLCME